MEISEVALPSGGDMLGATDRQAAGSSGWPAFVFRWLKLLFTFLFLTSSFVSLLLSFACLLLSFPYTRTRYPPFLTRVLVILPPFIRLFRDLFRRIFVYCILFVANNFLFFITYFTLPLIPFLFYFSSSLLCVVCSFLSLSSSSSSSSSNSNNNNNNNSHNHVIIMGLWVSAA